MLKADLDKWEKVCAAAESHSYEGFRVSTAFFRELLDDIGKMTEVLELINAESMSEQTAFDSLLTCVNLAAKGLSQPFDSSVEGAKACECGHLNGEHSVRQRGRYCNPCDSYCDGES